MSYKHATGTRLAARAAVAKDLESYYRKNRREVEAEGKRSKELFFGRVGIRATAEALKLLKGWKWEDVVAALKTAGGAWLDFVAVKETVMKDALKRSGACAEALAGIGVRVKSGEEFFIETYPEKAAPVQLELAREA